MYENVQNSHLKPKFGILEKWAKTYMLPISRGSIKYDQNVFKTDESANERVYKKIYRNVYDGAIRCQCGLVETVPTNDHIMLQA